MDEQTLTIAIQDSRSIRQALLKLGWKTATQDYIKIRALIQQFDIDTSHFTLFGPEYKRGRETPISDYLNNSIRITSHLLRVRLLEEKIFKHECSRCFRTTWQGETIPLELNHIDGNHYDNTLSNLQLLCPNCHALTPHYKGRGKRLKNTKCKYGHWFEVAKTGRRFCRTCKRRRESLRRLRIRQAMEE